MRAVTLIGTLSVLTVLFYWLDSNLSSFYIFKPSRLQELAKASIAKHPNNVTALMVDLNAALQEEYGSQHIASFTTNPDRWIWRYSAPLRYMIIFPIALSDNSSWYVTNAYGSNHGSAMGAFTILHASITEYLIFYGTPIYSNGHSGLHLADDYFVILNGTEKAYRPGQLEATTYWPGDVNHLPRGQSIHYAMDGWALELAQGWIPSMLPFGLVESFTSNLDFVNLWKTCYLTAELMGRQLGVGKF